MKLFGSYEDIKKRVTNLFYQALSVISSILFWLAVAIIAIIVLIIMDRLYEIESLGILSNILQILTVCIAIAAWLEAKNNYRIHKSSIKDAYEDKKATVLVIDITDPKAPEGKKGSGILNGVLDYMRENAVLNEYSPIDNNDSSEEKYYERKEFVVSALYSRHLFYVEGEKMSDNPQGYIDSLSVVLEKIEEYIREKNSSTILLFCKCPVVVSYLAGMRGRNNFNMIIHHYSSTTGKYVPIDV